MTTTVTLSGREGQGHSLVVGLLKVHFWYGCVALLTLDFSRYGAPDVLSATAELLVISVERRFQRSNFPGAEKV